MQLRGDRNQCQGCKEFFNSTFAFDKHRTGEHGKNRRCLTVEEMQSREMVKNSDLFWVSKAKPDEAVNAKQTFSAEVDTLWRKHEKTL